MTTTVIYEQRTYMIGKLYEARKHRGNQYTANNAATQNGREHNKQGTAGEIAHELGMGNNTVIRAEKFAKGIESGDSQNANNQYTEIHLGHFGLIGLADMVLKTR